MRILFLIFSLISYARANDCPEGQCHFTTVVAAKLALQIQQVLLYEELKEGDPEYHLGEERFKRLSSLSDLENQSKVLLCVPEEKQTKLSITVVKTQTPGQAENINYERVRLSNYYDVDPIQLGFNLIYERYRKYAFGGECDVVTPNYTKEILEQIDKCSIKKAKEFFSKLNQDELKKYLIEEFKLKMKNGFGKSDQEISAILNQGQLNNAFRDVVILVGFVSSSDIDPLKYLKESTSKLSTDEKIRLVSVMGGLLGNIYDFKRAEAGLFAQGAPSTQSLLGAINDKLISGRGTPTGVCRDDATLQAKMLESMGFASTYVVGYAMPGAYHVTVYTEDPDTKAPIKFNYYNVDRADGVIGPSALDQHSFAQQSMNFVLAKPSGEIVKAVDSLQGRRLYEAIIGEDVGRSFGAQYQGNYLNHVSLKAGDDKIVFASTASSEGEQFYALTLRSQNKTDRSTVTTGVTFFDEDRNLNSVEKSIRNGWGVTAPYVGSLGAGEDKSRALGVAFAVNAEAALPVLQSSQGMIEVYGSARTALGLGLSDNPLSWGPAAPTFYIDDRFKVGVKAEADLAGGLIQVKSDTNIEGAVLPLSNITNFQSGPVILNNGIESTLSIQEKVIGSYLSTATHWDAVGFSVDSKAGIQNGPVDLGVRYVYQNTAQFAKVKESGVYLDATYLLYDAQKRTVGSIQAEYDPQTKKLDLSLSLKQ